RYVATPARIIGTLVGSDPALFPSFSVMRLVLDSAWRSARDPVGPRHGVGPPCPRGCVSGGTRARSGFRGRSTSTPDCAPKRDVRHGRARRGRKWTVGVSPGTARG